MDRDKRFNLLVCLALMLTVAALYAPVAGFQFLSYDDRQYLLENANVNSGLSLRNLYWAFTSFYQANWHPLTWLSHMVDVQLFGLNPAGHHLVSVVLHCANSILLFLFLRQATGASWRSAVVAALFALHPLHVESVAWVAERKDVLAACFGLAALLAYVRYGRKPSFKLYLPVAGLFLLGLLAKPMLVTLPFLLLLLDYWPLARWPWTGWRRLAAEKIPLLLLSAGSCWLTFLAQNSGIVNVERPLAMKVANAAVSYSVYLKRMILPADLAVLYPFAPSIPGWQATGAVVLLAAITVLAFHLRQRQPWLLFGWLWYLGMLVPVIGLVTVGYQANADRYTYLPLIGIFIMVAWGGAALVAGHPARQRAAVGIILSVLAGCWIVARGQLMYWRDSIDLFSRAVAVTRDNFVAWNNLGAALHLSNRYGEALRAYEASLKIMPDQALPHNNIGLLLVRLGRPADALPHYRQALTLQPDYREAAGNLGVALVELGDLDGAVEQFARSVRVEIGSVEQINRFRNGFDMIRHGEYAGAVALFDEAVRREPARATDYAKLGAALIRYGRGGQ